MNAVLWGELWDFPVLPRKMPLTNKTYTAQECAPGSPYPTFTPEGTKMLPDRGQRGRTHKQ